jgi:hypothetical protein
MSLENESGPFELRWEDFTALSRWLKNKPPPKNREALGPAQKGHHTRKRLSSAKNRRTRVGSALFFAFVAMLLALFIVSPSGKYTNWGLIGVWFIVGFLLGAFVILLLLAWAKVIHPQTEKNFLTLPADEWQRGPWRVRISPDGIENTSPLATSMYRWEVIWSMGQTEDHLIYMISSQRGVAVPRRAFISDEHFDDFAESARRYRSEAEQILDAEAAPPDEEAPRPERPSTDIRL